MRRNVAILLFDEVEVLDFAGPFEVFAVTDSLRSHELFKVFTVSLVPGAIRARNGLKVIPDYNLDDCPEAQILVVPGGWGTRPLLGNPVLLEWIRNRSRAAEVTMSVCTGSLLLAKAGLLDGLRITTHRSAIDSLRELAPRSTVDPSKRFHDNGSILTSAGISAGIDCSLYLVGRLLGAEVSTATAEHMEYDRRG
jgi:transcriptional regulator GlxA family with amidase domain